MKSAKNDLDPLGSIYNDVDVIIFVVDVTNENEYICVSVNNSHEKLSGISVEWLVGKTINEIKQNVEQSVACFIDEYFQKCVELKIPIRTEQKIILKGRETWWLVTFNPLTDENNRVYRIVGTSVNITERIEREKQIIANEKRIRNIINNSKAGYFYINSDGIFKRVNQAWLELHKYETTNEIIGKHYSITYTQEDANKSDIYLKHVLMGKCITNAEISRKCKDDSIGYHFFSANPVYEDNKVIGMEGFLIDTTQYMLVQKENNLNRTRLDALWHLSRITDKPLSEITNFALEESVRLTNSKLGYICLVNKSETTQTLYAWSKETMKECEIEDKNLEFNSEDGGIISMALLKKEPVIINNYASPHPEKKGYPKGHVNIERYLAVPILDNDKVVLVAGVANKDENYNSSDINQLSLFMDGLWKIIKQKSTDEELRKNEAQLKQIVQNMPFLLYALDEQNNIICWNKEAERITGYSNDEVKSNSDFFDLLYPDKEYRNEIMAKFSDSDNDFMDFETLVSCKDGKQRNILWSNLSKMHPIDGWTKWGVGLDVSSMRAVQKHLQDAVEKARHEDRQKSAFLANMSHEIRTPLNVIIGFVDLMLFDSEVQNGIRENLNYIKESGSHLLQLINDILELSKIEAGEVTINSENIALKDEVIKCITNGKVLISSYGKDVLLKCVYSGNLPEEVKIDGTKFRQILNNLISNAVKFTDKGVIKITVNKKDNNVLLFSINDTGIGIDNNKINEIFKPFTQGSKDISATYGGTGLGLSITKRLVEMLGGDISVKSQSGKGTEFLISIPYEDVSGKISKNKEHDTKLKKDIGKHKILIAEDDKINRIFMEKLLIRLNMETIFANNGLEAIDFYKQMGDFDLIIMDIRMPVVDGLEATKTIREIEKSYRRPPIPIIALTAAAMEEDKEKGLKAGCDEYITKPFNTDIFISTLEKYLQ